MCGIVGFTRPGDDAKAVTASMTETLVHRGPDGEGIHVNGAIAFGHRRLAIIDPAGGAQPRFDQDSGDALVFNGEIYGYRTLAEGLRRDGAALFDHSDTEVLFHMLRRYGVAETLERIDGMFAFAFYEGRSGHLYLARDRFGEKPLFYGIRRGALIFASEVKAMRRHPAFNNVGLDKKAVHQYLTYEYLPGDKSGFADIRKLRPGHLLVFADGEADVRRYWRPKYGGGDPSLNEEQAVDRLDELLNESVRQRLIADVPVGLFLSGGVDSGLLAAVAARRSSGITAFTVRMPESSYDETPNAVRIARHCGLPHQTVELSNNDVMEAFHAVSAMIDEPLADYSLLPTYLVCRAARKSMTVALGGDGGDELFAGYSSFKARRYSTIMAKTPALIGSLLRSGLNLLPAAGGYMNMDFVLRHVSQGFGYPVDYQNTLWMAPFTVREKVGLWRPDALPDDNTFRPIDELLDADAPTDPVERLLYLFTLTYLPEDILAKVDRASMYNSLEVRAPYLSRAFAEFAMSLPPHWKDNGSTTKYLLKKLAARYLPAEVVYQPKHGFGLPLAELLRGPLYQATADVLMNPTDPIAGWFEKTVIETLLGEHRSGKRDHRKKLWTLYILFLTASRYGQV